MRTPQVKTTLVYKTSLHYNFLIVKVHISNLMQLIIKIHLFLEILQSIFYSSRYNSIYISVLFLIAYIIEKGQTKIPCPFC